MFLSILKKALINFFLIAIILSFLALITYHLAYQNKIYPGVKVLGTNLGNLTKSQAKESLNKKVKEFETGGFGISLNGEEFKTSLAALGLKPDPKLTAEEAYSLGRKENIWLGLKTKTEAWFQGITLPFQITKDQELFANFLKDLNEKVKLAAVEASVSLEEGQIILNPSSEGLELDFESSKIILGTKISHLESLADLPTRIIYPTVTKDRALQAYDKVVSLAEKNFAFRYKDKSFPISKEKLVDLLTFTNQKEELVPVLDLSLGKARLTVRTLSFNSEQKPQAYSLVVSVSKDKAKELVSSIAKQINRQPTNAKFNFVDGRVESFTPHSEGLTLDESLTLENFQKSFDTQEPNINLAVKVSSPEVTNESANNLGIKELLGKGVSKFAGSAANRAHNIGLGANRVNGTLIPPGETFSLYKTIGEVDASTGYKEAYVIIGKRTLLDWGGGICQVSTTLFRAALNAGLPIIERNPHAYRVGYYEQGGSPGSGKPGIDAAVFFPNSDFKFKNDTGGYILIQTVLDLKNSSLAFEIYGTNDGRKVNISTPVVTNQVKPPEPLYQEDPTLDKGQVKQIDFSAWGANTVFNRTVIRNGEVIIKDAFYTKYRPWQAVFLVGTKDPNAPPPEPTPTPSPT